MLGDPERELLDRLTQALSRYRQAVTADTESETLRIDCGPTHPDGLTARRRSLQRFNAALRDYRTALREWRDFVFYRKTPEWLSEKPTGAQAEEEPPGRVR